MISVDKIETVSYAIENGKINRKESSFTPDLSRYDSLGAAKLICKYSSDQSFKNIIDYPHCVGVDGQNTAEIFKWFAKNRGGLNDPTILRSLSTKNDVDYSLPKYFDEKSDKKHGKSDNGYRGPNDRFNKWNNNRNKKWNNNYKKGNQE